MCDLIDIIVTVEKNRKYYFSNRNLSYGTKTNITYKVNILNSSCIENVRIANSFFV